MGSELLLYAYGAVCLSMIVFNIVYNIILNRRDRRLARISGNMEHEFHRQLENIRCRGEIDEAYMDSLIRRLSRVNQLMAFDQMLDESLEKEEDSEAVGKYLEQLHPVFIQLADIYQDRENVQAAYFAYFLSKHKPKVHMAIDVVQDIMVEYMRKDNFYCRVNALAALYAFGSPESVAEAVRLQDRSGNFFHEKVLTDGLLSYTGNHDRLIDLLWADYKKFSIRTQLSVLNYIRYRSGHYKKEMYQIMTDNFVDKELRLAAIRYFGKYIFPPARDDLIRFAIDKDPMNWEYAAISISALGRYQGKSVMETLFEAIHSSNWYIRYNASSSLEAHGLDYNNLLEIVGGQDRYAREIMMYRLDTRRLELEEREEVPA